MPRAATATPPTASHLYLPVRDTIWPVVADAVTMPSIMGVSMSPAPVAEECRMFWANSGR